MSVNNLNFLRRPFHNVCTRGEIYNFSKLITRENHFYAVGQLFVCIVKYVFTSCCFNGLPPVAGTSLYEHHKLLRGNCNLVHQPLYLFVQASCSFRELFKVHFRRLIIRDSIRNRILFTILWRIMQKTCEKVKYI